MNRKQKAKTENHNAEIERLLKTRLDAILRLLISITPQEKGKKKSRIADVAPLLYSAGLTPTEIATLFGKKKATEVAGYLYRKKVN